MSLNHRRVPRFQRALFAEYLRLLDARDDGASLRTIAGHVYRSRVGADDLVRKRLKAAEALRDGGYRDLLLWTGKIELPDFLQSIPDEFDELTELAESGDSEGFEQLMAKLVQKRNR